MSKDFLEHKAFVELFDLHYGNLVGFVYGYVRDEEVAKDIVHDAFLTFWTNRKHLDLSYSAKSYLFCKILFVYVGPELCVELLETFAGGGGERTGGESATGSCFRRISRVR